MPTVRLGELVVAKVQRREAGSRQTLNHVGLVIVVHRLEAHVDASRLTANAVGELGDIPRVDVLVELEEGAGALRDLHGDEGLRRVRTLRDEAQTIEVHVGAAGDGNEGLAAELVARGVLLEAGDGQGPGWLEDHACVDEVVLDGTADLVGAHQDDLVEGHLAQPEGLVTNLANRSPISKKSDGGELHHLTSVQTGLHPGGVHGLDADDLDARLDGLQEHAHARRQTTSPDTAEDCVDLLLRRLRQDLLAYGSLAGDHQRVVEGVHQHTALLLDALHGRGVRLVVAVAGEDDLGGVVDSRPHGVHLDLGRSLRHEYLGGDVQRRRCEGDPLGMVPGGARHDALRLLLRAQVHDAVVRAPQLEAVDRLLVLPLQEHLVARLRRQLRRVVQVRVLADIVHLGVQGHAQVVVGIRAVCKHPRRVV
mmetsp:Transcript_53113/g.153236  ORF Transcript_53113/g.153236 Transcript_53113/m.153236 type:complete len:422 (+) Transcript_53113:502-1767(+)